MRYLLTQILLSSMCYANLESIESHVAELQKPQSDDLFALTEAFLKPFPEHIDDIKQVSKIALIYQEARNLFESGDLEKSKLLLKSTPIKSSYNFQSLYILGAIEIRENQPKQASQIFESILKIKPQSETDQEIRQLAIKALALIADNNHHYRKALSWFEELPHTEYEQAEIYRIFKQYPKAEALLNELELRLKRFPSSWTADQPEIQKLDRSEKDLKQEESQLNTAESDYKELVQQVLGFLDEFKSQMEKLSHPELEIPLDPQSMSEISVNLDEKNIYENRVLQANTTVSFPVSYGQHKLVINNKSYWVNVFIDDQFETQFDFMDTKLGNLPEPDLSNVNKIHGLLEQTEKLQKRLLEHHEPIFEQTRAEIKKSLEQNQQAHLTEEKKLLPAISERVDLIKIEIQLIKASQAGEEVKALEQEKTLKLEQMN